MFLILCSAADQSAVWAYDQLRRFGIAPIDLVTTESLSYSSWDHRLGVEGNTIRITLPGGRIIESKQIKAALNRVMAIGAEQANRATQVDRDYAMSELNAFYLSWLHSLRDKLTNRATPQGLCGRWRHPSEWMALAEQAGLQVRPYRQSDEHPVDQPYKTGATTTSGRAVNALIFKEHVFGACLPSHVARSSVQLARLAGLDLMGVDFEIAPNHDYLFTGASPMPDLFRGGAEFIRALARSWQAMGESL